MQPTHNQFFVYIFFIYTLFKIDEKTQLMVLSTCKGDDEDIYFLLRKGTKGLLGDPLNFFFPGKISTVYSKVYTIW
jgi:hypothetical protein